MTDMIDHQKITSEIYSLTGIRAAAALWVVAFHLQARFDDAYPSLGRLIAPIVSHGYLGVDLFFILSGFVIHYNYADRLSKFSFPAYLEFLWLRLARLWPVHGVVLGLFALLLWVQHMVGKSSGKPELYTTLDFVKNLFLVHGWSIPLRGSWNVAAWSISCEWLAYIFFPVFIISRSQAARPIRALVVAATGLIGTALACQCLRADGGIIYGVVRIAGEFIAGCGLCHIFCSGVARSLPWRQIVPVTIIAVLVGTHFVLPALGLVSYWSVPLLGVMVLGLAHQQCIVSRWCSCKAMLFGGYISYSIYMVHELCLIVLKNAPLHISKGFALVVDMAAIITVSILMYYFVEEPCRKAMRRIYPWHKLRRVPGV